MDRAPILLLLSGGKDSALCLKILKEQNHRVTALCISGKQGLEAPGAKDVANRYNVHLTTIKVSVFDELTWNPLKLIYRDLIMGTIVIRHCLKNKIREVAVGVKVEDLENPKLFWLRPFLKFSKMALGLFRISLLFPLIPDKLI